MLLAVTVYPHSTSKLLTSCLSFYQDYKHKLTMEVFLTFPPCIHNSPFPASHLSIETWGEILSCVRHNHRYSHLQTLSTALRLLPGTVSPTGTRASSNSRPLPRMHPTHSIHCRLHSTSKNNRSHTFKQSHEGYKEQYNRYSSCKLSSNSCTSSTSTSPRLFNHHPTTSNNL